MTSRAKLQEKSLDELRTIAEKLSVPDYDTLQKSKLIVAILNSDGFEASSELKPVELPGIEKVRGSDAGAEAETGAAESAAEAKRQEGEDRGAEGPHGKRRRRRSGGQQRDYDEADLEEREGILDILPEGYGFLRVTGYLPGEKDVYVSASQIRKFGLRRGDLISGPIRPPRSQEKFPALIRIDRVNGGSVDDMSRRPKFGDLTPLFPDERLRLEVKGHPERTLPRIMDLISPIGKGQRGLIVSPPKAGKTTVLKEVANSITANNPECHLIVVLVDERPEEVTDMQRSVKGEVIYST
ncbi:MAG: Rho termination factor N-terminal domain-containing protein, partial [Acidimicrobiia bacterium]